MQKHKNSILIFVQIRSISPSSFLRTKIIKSNSQRVRGEGEKTRKNTQRFILCSYENSIIASSSSLFRHKQLHFAASRYFRLKFIFFISNNQQERKIKNTSYTVSEKTILLKRMSRRPWRRRRGNNLKTQDSQKKTLIIYNHRETGEVRYLSSALKHS